MPPGIQVNILIHTNGSIICDKDRVLYKTVIVLLQKGTIITACGTSENNGLQSVASVDAAFKCFG